MAAGVVQIPWYATLFRGDKFEAALREIAPVAMRYGATDYVVYMFGDPDAVPAAPVFCLVKSTNPDRPYKAYVHVDATKRSVVCGLPARDLRTTKAIRWRLAGRLHGIVDRAPDSGWNA